MTHEFILDGLNCAHCAAKIEQKITEAPEYSDVRFSFATKALSLNAKKRDVREDIQKIVDAVEDGVTVVDAKDYDDDKEEKVGKVKVILLAAAAGLFVGAFVTHFFENLEVLTAILSVLAVLLSGYDVIIEGVKSAFKFRIDETTLMTVAVIAAAALGEFVEAAAVTVLFGIGEILEDKAVEKSRRDIKKLADIRPDSALVKNGAAAVETPAEKVAVGSIIEILPHRRVPLDGVVVSGESTVDASSLTGESIPIPAKEGVEILSGCVNGDKTILLKTTKPYADSAATRIVKLVEESAKNKGEREKLISRFARVYTPAVIIMALLIAFVPPIFLGDFPTWIKRALVCLVASCPCSIVISVPLAYYAGIGAASKHGILIKGGKFVEVLSKARCFAFDKTGTLTDNHISVKEIKPLSRYTEEEILQFAVSAEKNSSHPIAEAVRAYAKEHDISHLELTEYQEHSAKGVSAKHGAKTVSVGKSGDRDGVTVSLDGEDIGIIFLSENIRKETPSVIQKLRALKISTVAMLTGDRKSHAQKVAQELGIDRVYSELLPEDKVGKVEELLSENELCCFVGDGINDAPVLSRSSCGIAMGLSSDAAIESADTVLSSGDLKNLPAAIRIARSTMGTVKANIIFSLVFKLMIIVLAALGIAPMWLAVFADTGVCVLCVLNSTRLIKKKYPV